MYFRYSMKGLLLCYTLFFTTLAFSQCQRWFCFNDHKFKLLNANHEQITDAEVYLNGYEATYDTVWKLYQVNYQVRDFKTCKDLDFHIEACHPDYDTLNETIFYGHAYRTHYLLKPGEAYFNSGGSKIGGQKHTDQLLVVLHPHVRETKEKYKAYLSLLDSLGLEFYQQPAGTWHHNFDFNVYLLNKKNGHFEHHSDSVCRELSVLQNRKDLFLIAGPAIDFGPDKMDLQTVGNWLTVVFHYEGKQKGEEFMEQFGFKLISRDSYIYTYQVDAYMIEGLNKITQKLLSCPQIKGVGYNSLMIVEPCG